MMEDEIIICPICGKSTDQCDYFNSIEEESDDLPNTSVLDLKVTVTVDNLDETLARLAQLAAEANIDVSRISIKPIEENHISEEY